MFGGQFGAARDIVGAELPPVYTYAAETAIQLVLTELHENLRDIYLEVYSLPNTSEYIFQHTARELRRIFGAYLPDYSESDFYETEIGTAGIMRGYMARKCDIHFSLEKKVERFLTVSLRAYRVPEEEQAEVLAYIGKINLRALADEVMQKLFAALEMKFDFTLAKRTKRKNRKQPCCADQSPRLCIKTGALIIVVDRSRCKVRLFRIWGRFLLSARICSVCRN